MSYRDKEFKENTAELFQGIDKACKYAVVYTEIHQHTHCKNIKNKAI